MPLARDVVADAERLEDSGDQLRAHEVWLAAARVNSDLEVLLGLGRSHMVLGQVEDAVSVLQRALALDPQSAKGNWFMGFAYHGLGEYQAARAVLERGLAVSDWAPARSILADCYWRLDQLSDAIRQFELAATSDPSNPETWYGLGRSLIAVDLARAQTALARSLDLAPDYWLAHRELGWTLTKSGHLNSAEAHLRKASSLCPEDGWTRVYLSVSYTQANRHLEAVAEARRAVELSPDVPLFLCVLADALSTLGDHEAAEREYLAAMALDVNDSITSLRYGRFLERRGRHAKAETYLRRAADSDPLDPRPVKALERIRSGSSKVV